MDILKYAELFCKEASFAYLLSLFDFTGGKVSAWTRGLSKTAAGKDRNYDNPKGHFEQRLRQRSIGNWAAKFIQDIDQGLVMLHTKHSDFVAQIPDGVTVFVEGRDGGHAIIEKIDGIFTPVTYLAKGMFEVTEGPIQDLLADAQAYPIKPVSARWNPPARGIDEYGNRIIERNFVETEPTQKQAPVQKQNNEPLVIEVQNSSVKQSKKIHLINEIIQHIKTHGRITDTFAKKIRKSLREG